MRKQNPAGQPGTVLIVGLGLIGGSYAKRLSAEGFRVLAITQREEDLALARQRGWIAQGSTEEDPVLIEEAELVVFAVYPHVLVDWVSRNQQAFRPGAVLTDVCGVKEYVVRSVQSFLREDVEFLGSHPMAGKEVSGIRYSDDAIFRGANFIITPTEKNTGGAVQMLKDLGNTLGFAHISVLSPEEHDKMVGYVSHLTHAIAVSLMNANDNQHLQEYTGDSFRDLTRIARINDALWTELFFLNKKNLTQEIDEFVAVLEDLKDKVAKEDTEGLRELFIRSTQRRALFDRPAE